MFERYTESARRVIFLARYHASQFGSPEIETEHMLLGMLREDKSLPREFAELQLEIQSITEEIVERVTIHEGIGTSADLPLSTVSARVLEHAAEEANSLGHLHIGTEHLLLGMVRERASLAGQILFERGVCVQDLRKRLQRTGETSQASGTLGNYKVAYLQPPFTPLGRFELALHVTDLDRSVAFYSSLGFKARGGRDDGALILQSGNCRLALYSGNDPQTRLQFRGADPGALAEMRVDFDTTSESTSFGERDIYEVRDPDGNSLKIVALLANEPD